MIDLRMRFALVAAAALAAAWPVREALEDDAVLGSIVATAVRMPVLASAVERLTPAPHVFDCVLGGTPATLIRPAQVGARPAVVFVNGATPRGRRDARVAELARALGRAGYLVAVPDATGLARGEITAQTLASTVAAARALAENPDARGGRVALVGVSTGAGLALVAATDHALHRRVSVVLAVGPYAEVRSVALLASTGAYADGGRFIPYPTRPYLALTAARAQVAALRPGRDRARLLALLSRARGGDPDPLAALRRIQRQSLGREARAVVDLFSNRRPERFASLYRALPVSIRRNNRRLSPVAAAARLHVPVEIASQGDDPYFPPADARRIAGAAPPGVVRLTTTFAHERPQVSLDGLGDLLRFRDLTLRALRLASGTGPARAQGTGVPSSTSRSGEMRTSPRRRALTVSTARWSPPTAQTTCRPSRSAGA